MKLSGSVVDDIPYAASAALTVSRPLLQLPQLVSDRSLASSSTTLADHTRALVSSDFEPAVETIAMPKPTYGNRPIGVLSPETRTLYDGLVALLVDALPPSSRAKGIDAHLNFGSDLHEEKRIVDFDISACYEYINHGVLQQELILQSSNASAVTALIELLSGLYPKGVGLPQALDASHRLADAYLDRVQRAIARHGYQIDRYADDFRVITEDWVDAHQSIELAGDAARDSGLVLADGKTYIRSASQLKKIEVEREALLEKYRQQAADNLQWIEITQTDYDSFEFSPVFPSPEDVNYEALRQIVQDWVSGSREKKSLHALFGAQALKVLRNAPDRIETDWLVDIASRDPIRLQSIIVYLLGRPETDANWSALQFLSNSNRLSAWSRLWILRAADELESPDAIDPLMISWIRSLLNDRSEVVRAEAAWVLAGLRRVSLDEVAQLFIGASDISFCGLAAAAGRIDAGSASKVGIALKSENRLTREAYAWGEQDAS